MSWFEKREHEEPKHRPRVECCHCQTSGVILVPERVTHAMSQPAQGAPMRRDPLEVPRTVTVAYRCRCGNGKRSLPNMDAATWEAVRAEYRERESIPAPDVLDRLRQLRESLSAKPMPEVDAGDVKAEAERMGVNPPSPMGTTG